MVPEAKMERTSAIRNHTVIRANPGQTAILKASFSVSKSPTQDQMAVLSEQTGLTIKWISQWFARQRTKDRKNHPDTSARNGSTRPDTAGLGFTDVMRSPEDILQVKLEDGDPMGLLPSSPGAPTGSVSEYTATLSASSSVVLDLTQPGLAIESSKKRRRTGPRNKASSTARSLRSKRKGPAIIESPRVKKELIEASLSAADSAPLPASQPAPNLGVYPGDNHAQTQTAVMSTVSRPTASARYQDILPMIGPPKRSPMSTGVNHGGPNAGNTRSGLPGANKSHSVYARSSVSALVAASTQGGDLLDTQFHDVPAHARGPKTQRTAFYQQGPVLRTQFYNNGPSNYISTPLDENASYVAQSMPYEPSPAAVYDYSNLDTLASSSSSGSVAQMPYHTLPHPLLTPAFDWEDHIPFQSTDALYPQQKDFWPMGHYTEQTAYAGQDSVNADYGSFFQSNYYNSDDAVLHVLDPLHAPVKYLTHILDDFRDEQGMYVVNDELKTRLVGEDVVLRDPFQAAMGLAFLSRIGVEW